MRKLILPFLSVLVFSQSEATIDVSIVLPEVIVFASDGRIVNDSTTEIFTDSYEKIVEVTEIIIAQMQGTSRPGNKNLKTLIKDFKWKYKLKNNSDIYIDSLMVLFSEYCRNQKEMGVDFMEFQILFGGLDAKGNLKYFQFKPSKDDEPQQQGYGLYLNGVTNVADRLIYGIDPLLKMELLLSLRRFCPDSVNIDAAKNFIQIIEKYSIYNLTEFFEWSLRDAIDYAYTIVKTTIVIDQMVLGKYFEGHDKLNPRTGGQILECIVTRDGIKWIVSPKANHSWNENFDYD